MDYDYDFDGMDSGDVLDLFESAIGEVMKNRRASGLSVNRRASVLAIANKNPALHQAYLKACTGSLKAQRLIDEKYDAMPQSPRARSRR